jgi:predicted lipoprotein with Yx(FWY)xxD motif
MTTISKAICAIGFALAATAVSAAPVQNVSAKKHPNLAAAQHLATQAYDKVVAAQKANEFDLGGHAAKAKDLLEQATRELKAAAETANAKGH